MSAPVIGEAVPGVAAGFAGHPRPGWEVRLVDEHDQPVPVGAVGEGIVRAALPFMMAYGYFGDDAATARAWRHGWFHTGDLLRADESGALHFVDRTGDAIRRRGENVSAFEVEVGVGTYPGIAEVAAVPVASDSGVEHDIKAWVVPAPGTEIGFPRAARALRRHDAALHGAPGTSSSRPSFRSRRRRRCRSTCCASAAIVSPPGTAWRTGSW